MANLLSRLDDHVVHLCVRRLPVHPRPFAVTARAGKRLQRAVEAAREELGEQACEEHGLESARGEAAGLKLLGADMTKLSVEWCAHDRGAVVEA